MALRLKSHNSWQKEFSHYYDEEYEYFSTDVTTVFSNFRSQYKIWGGWEEPESQDHSQIFKLQTLTNIVHCSQTIIDFYRNRMLINIEY